jgi:oligopeptidase B
MYLRAGLNDSQEPYWEAAKFAARLRTLKTDAEPVLVSVNMDAGHGGASGRYERMKETAFDYAFLLHALGV